MGADGVSEIILKQGISACRYHLLIGICEDVTEHGLRETLEDFDSGRQVKASNVLYYFFSLNSKKIQAYAAEDCDFDFQMSLTSICDSIFSSENPTSRLAANSDYRSLRRPPPPRDT